MVPLLIGLKRWNWEIVGSAKDFESFGEGNWSARFESVVIVTVDNVTIFGGTNVRCIPLIGWYIVKARCFGRCCVVAIDCVLLGKLIG